jgi:hypothetical protein
MGDKCAVVAAGGESQLGTNRDLPFHSLQSRLQVTGKARPGVWHSRTEVWRS